MSFVRFLFIAIFLSCFGANELRAQSDLAWPEWQLTGTQFLPTYTVEGYFFFDRLHGLILINNGTSTVIYNTLVVAGTWKPSIMPATIKSVRIIRLIQGKLYAATEQDLLVSSDSGRSWIFSGLGLNDANDIYADRSGIIHILTNPMTRFARIDTMHCVASGGGTIFVSSDGGVNWRSAVTGMGPTSVGAFADPCHHIFVCPNSSGIVLRSSDSGSTWQSVSIGPGSGPELMEGASTVPYVSDRVGLFRSIDDGVTWTSIITVNAGPHTIFVFGPMGEHVVADLVYEINPSKDSLGIFMTTTGGDDNLHSAVAITDSNGAPLMQDDTFNVPFRVVSQCNTFSIPIALEAEVPGLFVKTTLTANGGGDIGLLGVDSFYFSKPVLNQRYSQDTIWLTYDPHHPLDTATLTFENHWNCSDWTETRNVILISYPTAQITPPPVLAGNCSVVKGSAFITLDSCQTLVIDSLDFPPSILSRLHLTTPLPDTLRLGLNDSLDFTFNPVGTVANIVDSLEIFAHFPGMDSALAYFDFRGVEGFPTPSLTNIDQFIPIHLIALPAGIALFSPDTVIALHRASYCERALDTSVTFTNHGCAPDTISQVSLVGAGYSMAPVSPPIIVQADSSVTFALDFLAPDTGSFSGSLTMQAQSGATKSFSIPLSGTGFPHAGVLASNLASLDAGRTYLCQELDTFVVVQDTGCDSVCITGVSVSSSGFVITKGGGAFCIGPGNYDTVWLSTKIDTTGGVLVNNASLTFNSNAQPALAPIKLSREIEYPIPWGLHLSPSDSAAAGTDVEFEIIQSGTLPADVTTIDFTITYDDDLLSYLHVDEQSVDTVGYIRTADGLAHLSFHVTPIGSDSIVATLHFTPYVARHSQTAIGTGNLSFVSTLSRPGDCIASLTTGQSVFSLKQECGYHELTEVLIYGVVRIDNIEPNPAAGSIVVSVSSGGVSPEPAQLSIVDELGRTVCEQAVTLIGGKNSFPMNIENLPSGIYAARLHTVGVASLLEFVKE